MSQAHPARPVVLPQNRGETLIAGKPDAIVQKMVDGQISKWMKEICLLDQQSGRRGVGLDAVAAGVHGHERVAKLAGGVAVIKAGAHDSEMVRALGINLSRLRLFVFALGVALAAIAGVTMAPIWGVRPHVGVDAVVPAFLIIVLGGVGSFTGAKLLYPPYGPVAHTVLRVMRKI